MARQAISRLVWICVWADHLSDQAGRFQFPGTSTNSRTVTIGRDLLFGGESTSGGQNGLVVQDGTAKCGAPLARGQKH
ncbi:MAG: hypothetical protein RML35_01265 [Chloroherpetonaceae bacterium]|nr:hypothetical protein [Chloroherpetonaceae bacterium]